MKVLYVAGAYSSSDYKIRDAYIKKARDMAIRLWEMGFAVICPHLNTHLFDEIEEAKGISYNQILEGDFELIKRCDGIVFLDNWMESEGAKKEFKIVITKSIPFFFEDELNFWKKIQEFRNGSQSTSVAWVSPSFWKSYGSWD